MFRGRVRHVHFIGVGGIGMSGLAEILRTLEFDVSGSDLRAGENTKNLERLGVRIDIGHRADNVHGADVVVYSSAIDYENPEVREARLHGIPVIPRAEMLAELMRRQVWRCDRGQRTARRRRRRSSRRCCAPRGFDPTVVVGGQAWRRSVRNARLGAGDLLVAEADESDGSFLRLTPTIAVVTNIDPEHLDHYKLVRTRSKMRSSQFIAAGALLRPGGALPRSPARAGDLLPRVQRRHVTYGLSARRPRITRPRASSFQAGFRRRICRVYKRGRSRSAISRSACPGIHNVLKTRSRLVAIADELEVPLDVTKRGARDLRRRGATLHGRSARSCGVTLRRRLWPPPGRGRGDARTPRRPRLRQAAWSGGVPAAPLTRAPQTLFEEFTRAFNLADLLFVTDIYAAGEAPIEGVTSEALGCTSIRRTRPSHSVQIRAGHRASSKTRSSWRVR